MSLSTGVSDATVGVTWQVGYIQPQVNPSTATISTQGKVTWGISVPSGYTVQIEFADQGGVKGPFPLSGQPDNPSRGVYESGATDVQTAAADAANNTDWKYSVAVYKGTTRVSFVDPVIRIKDN